MWVRTLFWSPLLWVAIGCSSPTDTAKTQTAPVCTTTDGITVVNGLLQSLTPVLDKAWPSVAVSTGLDPWKDPVPKQKVPLKCSYGGDEACGGLCKEEYAEVAVSKIQGLAYMQFKDLTMTSLKADPGPHSCVYGLAKGGTYACSYTGTGTGSAFLLNGQQLTADISELKLKAKCDFFGASWTVTLFDGSAHCTGSEPEGTGTLQVCAGSCASGGVANLSYTGLNKLDLKLGKLSCHVKPDYNPLSWVGDALAPELKQTLLNAIEPQVQTAINDFVADYMPFPSSCGS